MRRFSTRFSKHQSLSTISMLRIIIPITLLAVYWFTTLVNQTTFPLKVQNELALLDKLNEIWEYRQVNNRTEYFPILIVVVRLSPEEYMILEMGNLSVTM